MTKDKRFRDIQNRWELAIAERNFCELGTENYETLSEVAKLINGEIAKVVRTRSESRVPRYGFRLMGAKYHLIVLPSVLKV